MKKGIEVPGLIAVIVVLGMVMEEVAGESSILASILTVVPDLLAAAGFPCTIFGGYTFVRAIWINLAVPSLLIFGTAGLSLVASRWREPLLSRACAYAACYLPLLLAVHAAKLLQHAFVGEHEHELVLKASALQSQEAAVILPPIPEYIAWFVVLLGLIGSLFCLTRVREKRTCSTMQVVPFISLALATALFFFICE